MVCIRNAVPNIIHSSTTQADIDKTPQQKFSRNICDSFSDVNPFGSNSLTKAECRISALG